MSDAAYDRIMAFAEAQGLELYPHQEEAILELLAGSNVVLATPTGSGKSLVATAAHMAAMAEGRRSFYTAPIKALVSEKFFALCEVFGAKDVGLLTGDASVNPDAPIVACTAEVLANISLREGSRADVGLVIMDEFHYYADPQRGWAWQVPLLELTDAQFVLMSATLGDVSELAKDLTARNGRETAVVAKAERPVPLHFSWSLEPLDETLKELVETGQAPVYVVHFTQAGAVQHAESLLKGGGFEARQLAPQPAVLAERLAGVRFGAGFGKTLAKLLRRGIGVHHAGMLPRYRRLVEQLAQEGLLTVICGTDTLGVGINVPIRTVLFTGLAKYDGQRQRVLRSREFLQIAGRAGRPGFDTNGYVVAQAPEHVIENEKAKAKAAAKNAAMSDVKLAKRKSKAQLRKPPEGTVVWTRATFDKLVAGAPEPLRSKMKVDNAMLVNVAAREEDAFAVMRRLLTDNHEDRRTQLRLARRALRLARGLVRNGVLQRLDEPDQLGRRYVLTVELPEDFALNQPLALFAIAALDLLDPEAPTYALDIVSVIEAVLDPPRQILFAQQHEARGVAIGEMKADGLEYDERMALLEEVTWPKPLAELLEPTFETYRQSHPWLPIDALDPKSVVREMYEQGMGFTDFVGRYKIARSEGLLLRYLSDAYRTLRQTVPDAHRPPELEELVEWLGETVRQTDSSLLDEWEALSDPDHKPRTLDDPLAPPARPLSQQERAFRVMIRNAMWRRVHLVARDDLDGLAALEQADAERLDPPREVVMTRRDWDAAIEDYFAEHDSLGTDADARGPDLLLIEHSVVEGGGRRWQVRQTLADPAGHHDWVIEAGGASTPPTSWGSWCSPPQRCGSCEGQGVRRFRGSLRSHLNHRTAPMCSHLNRRTAPMRFKGCPGFRGSLRSHLNHRTAPLRWHLNHRTAPMCSHLNHRTAPLRSYLNHRTAPMRSHLNHRTAPMWSLGSDVDCLPSDGTSATRRGVCGWVTGGTGTARPSGDQWAGPAGRKGALMVLSMLRNALGSRPSPDVLRADAFLPGGQLTVGVEEELLLVDEAHQLVDEERARAWIRRAEELGRPDAGVVSAELFGSEIEFATAVCANAESAAQHLAHLRGVLVSTGARAMAVGVHPDAAFGEPQVTHVPRYESIGRDLGGILRTPTAALQVHVGLPDAASAVTAYRALRQHLPIFRALAAASPCWHGRDSGLASARAAVIASYPRSGLPPVVKSWDEYVALTHDVLTAADAPDHSYVWWGARIQARLGTVEIRVMDPQPSLSAAAGLTALVQGIAAHALEHPPRTDVPGEVLAENDFRVTRHGLETTILDATGTMRPVRAIATDLVADARDALRPLGLDAPLAGVESILAAEPEYVRHRRLLATHGMPALLADLVDRTTKGW